ncbi:CDP-glycerol glycerophosphotransferase family protein [Nocardiopsis composta]|uniref:CDP-glycerol glycerophosphotransferase n=1 Tax=Nocardiopsis composta TaxID=157465 RepID=A0A7W8VFD9_9ACTN|nr:CDP-glycerol glycerophosphotransferase family protein [Nocardiopsis composta]MBB5434307.1 CDP-glycerol glycerophosphotransferase [Nocardiopsis composta]
MTGTPFEIPDELRRRMRYLPEADPAEREAFIAEARRFTAEHGTAALAAGLGPVTRLKWYLAGAGRTDELLALIRHDREFPSAYRIKGLRRPRPDIPGVGLSSVPEEIAVLRKDEIPLRAKATSIDWVDGALRIRGYAFLRNVAVPERPRLPRFAWLSRPGERRRIRLPVRTRTEPQATLDSRQPLHCFDGAGIEITVDPARLRGDGGFRTGTWTLTLGVPGPHLVRRGGIAPGQVGREGHPFTRDLGDGHQLVCEPAKGRLRITVRRNAARVDAAAFGGGALRLELSARKEPKLLRVVREGGGEPDREYPLAAAGAGEVGLTRWTAELPLDGLRAPGADAATRHLRPVVVFADGTEERPAAGPSLVPAEQALGAGRELAVVATGTGLANLAERTAGPVVDSVEWSGGDLVLSGSYSDHERPMGLVLRHGERFEEVRLPFEAPGGRFAVRVAPERIDCFGDEVPLRKGRWYLRLRPAGERGAERDVPLRIRTDLLAELPKPLPGVRRAFRLDRRFHDLLFIASEKPLPIDAQGPYRQRLLREEFTAAAKREPLREAVLYNNFGGRQYSDSPRAVHEELVRRGVEVEHLWTVADQQAVPPEGVRPVEWKSREWYEALARSRYIVTNTNGGFGEWFAKREGQVVVQTWHGTPLKRIGADLRGTVKANDAYIASLPHQSRQWDVFVSPNTFATPVLKNAFAYEGDMLECGYPRNDLFHAPEEERRARAERTRRLIGVPEGKRVVLYAPTLRDDQRHSGKRFKLDLRVDLEAAEKELGGDHVLLIRKHGRVVDSIPGAGEGFVFDVSAYPDIADLFLITDVLITDYSSSFFDFAHSGRPMLFFTYDLEHYRDTLRGFYFDFAERAPGPLIKTSEELVRSIRDIDAVTEEYRERYAAFVRDFCDPSHGRAAADVVDRMLELGGK